MMTNMVDTKSFKKCSFCNLFSAIQCMMHELKEDHQTKAHTMDNSECQNVFNEKIQQNLVNIKSETLEDNSGGYSNDKIKPFNDKLDKDVLVNDNNDVSEDLESRLLSYENKIWNHFRIKRKENTKVEAECIYCGKVLKRRAEKTSSFLNHLRNYHEDKLPAKLQRKKFNRSIAWNHFKAVPKMKTKAECKYCGKWISKLYGSTSNMVRHFMINHQSAYNESKYKNENSETKTDYNKAQINDNDYKVVLNENDVDDPYTLFDIKDSHVGDNDKPIQGVVWNHFQINPDSKEEAKCNHCEKMFDFCDDMTGNLMHHLKDQHSAQVYGQKIIKTRVKKSFVWKHYKPEPNSEKAECNYCHKIFTIAQGSTSNIKRHLQTRHLDKLMYSDSDDDDDGNENENVKSNSYSSNVLEKLRYDSEDKMENTKYHDSESNVIEDESNATNDAIDDVTMNDTTVGAPLTLCDPKESLDDNEDLSIISNNHKIIKRRVKKSLIWDHCTLEPNKDQIECNYCDMIYSPSKGSTGNMKRHLENKHTKMLIDQPDEKNIWKKQSNGSLITNHFVPLSGVPRKTECNFCGAWKSNGNKTNMLKHLKNKHQILIKEKPPGQKFGDKKSNRSLVWDYFKPPVKGDSVMKCIYCGEKFANQEGNKTEMINHLEVKHPNKIEAFADEKMEQDEENSSTESTIERKELKQPGNSIWEHFILQPNTQDQFQCKYCENCEKPSTMISHLRKNHPNVMDNFTGIKK